MQQTSSLLSDPDPEIRSLAQEEYAELSQQLTEQLAAFPSVLIPPSQTAHFSALMELRAGVGGDESALFLSELLRMYSRLAQQNGFAIELVSFSPSDPAAGAGGGKEAILGIKGEGAYDKFRFESGVHRVQRVPATEAKGRLHTSTVAILVSLAVSTYFVLSRPA
jgi:peptide chain release factor 1